VAVGGVCLMLMRYMPSDGLKIAMIIVGIALPAVIFILVRVMVSELTPLLQRGGMLAITTAVATSGGLIAPYVMGSVVQNAGSPAEGYAYGFFICGAVALACGVIGMIFLRPQREVTRFAIQSRLQQATG